MSLPPGIKLPAFDNTLGALFIGFSVATILYGVICLQMFLYITSAQGQEDRLWLKRLVYFLFTLDTAHQLTMTAMMYKFLVSDYSNPALIPSGSAGSAELFTLAQSCIAAISILLVQLFFCWRISLSSLNIKYRSLFTGLTVSLALLCYASSMDLAVTGFNHHLLMANMPSFILAFKFSTSTRMSFDVMITIAMTISLRHARSSDVQNPRMDHIITLLTLFTVNTNLISTCLSVIELVTFLTLPNATVYGGISFLSVKTYSNTFFAVLNSRDYLREKLDQPSTISTTSQCDGELTFAIPPRHNLSGASRSLSGTSAGATGTFELATNDHNSNLRPNTSGRNTYGVNTTA